ncbi:methyltransferase domain-containing protein [archaeon]|nr:methyltransferase domain-containing protein [archaeon]
MKKYLFVFGRNPDVSLAEAISYFVARNLIYKIELVVEELAIISLDETFFKGKKIISQLGGTVKIGEILSEGDYSDLIPYMGSSSKIKYAVSSYGNPEYTLEFEDYLKSWFKSERIKAQKKKGNLDRLMPKDISSDLIEYLVFGKHIARSVAVSKPAKYKQRDLKRPENDFLKNTSIRLSKMLINLSQVKKKELLLDPFAGTGVILQEAMLSKINVIGVDIDNKTVHSAIKNCGWIKKEYNLKTNFKLIHDDSSNLAKYIESNSIDAVATEPYMGPYLENMITHNAALITSKKLEKMYFSVLSAISKVLKRNAKVVIIVPNFRTKKDGRVTFNFNALLDKLNFEIINLDKSVKFPLVYADSDSKIERQIYVISKK